uniref:G_PROTEIN_RECEP_F1_2 domain-containing protein n=1 Tax=Syphacia muris TaxID=451379 RepID=A0A0N5AZH8_9BILA
MADNYSADALAWDKQILQIYPSTTEPTQHTLITTVVLLLCTVMGTCGNASQISLQWYTKRLKPRSGNSTGAALQVCVCIIHSTYFCLSILLPLTILENLVKIWMFGLPTCLLYFVVYTAGRTLATWAITFLFIEQFEKTSKKLRITIPVASLIFTVGSVAIPFPFLYFIKVTETILYEEMGQDPNTLLQVITSSCSARYMNSTFMVILATTTFIAHSPRWLLVFSTLFQSTSGVPIPHWVNVFLENCDLLFPGINASIAWIPARYLSSYYTSYESFSRLRPDMKAKKNLCTRPRTDIMPHFKSHSSIEILQYKQGVERTNSLPDNKSLDEAGTKRRK